MLHQCLQSDRKWVRKGRAPGKTSRFGCRSNWPRLIPSACPLLFDPRQPLVKWVWLYGGITHLAGCPGILNSSNLQVHAAKEVQCSQLRLPGQGLRGTSNCFAGTSSYYKGTCIIEPQMIHTQYIRITVYVHRYLGMHWVWKARDLPRTYLGRYLLPRQMLPWCR